MFSNSFGGTVIRKLVIGSGHLLLGDSVFLNEGEVVNTEPVNLLSSLSKAGPGKNPVRIK